MAPRAAAAAIVFAIALIVAWSPAASASTISGHVGGGTIPSAGKGFASVRAVNAGTLVIAAAGKVKSGRYSLKVPAGGYLLYAATTPFRGKAGVDLAVGRVSVRSGKRRTLRLSLKKRRRSPAKRPKIKLPKIPGVTMAQAGFVPVKYPAVWIQHFQVSGPEDYKVLGKGFADMLITDVGATLKEACGGILVEREHLADILAEQLLSRSPLVDPTTRIQSGKIIAHNREVTGTLTVAGASATLTAKVTNVVTGKTRSVTRTAAADRPFELEQSIVQEVVRLICGGRPPVAYSGQLSGATSVSSSGSSQKLSWSGNVRLKLSGEPQAAIGDDPPGEYAWYEPESGSVHVILDGTEAECTYHGEATIALEPHPGELSRVQQDVDAPAYYLIASLPPAATLSYTTTGPSYCGGGQTSPFGLGGRVVLGLADDPALVVDHAGRQRQRPHRTDPAHVGVVAGAAGELSEPPHPLDRGRVRRPDRRGADRGVRARQQGCARQQPVQRGDDPESVRRAEARRRRAGRRRRAAADGPPREPRAGEVHAALPSALDPGRLQLLVRHRAGRRARAALLHQPGRAAEAEAAARGEGRGSALVRGGDGARRRRHAAHALGALEHDLQRAGPCCVAEHVVGLHRVSEREPMRREDASGPAARSPRA